MQRMGALLSRGLPAFEFSKKSKTSVFGGESRFPWKENLPRVKGAAGPGTICNDSVFVDDIQKT